MVEWVVKNNIPHWKQRDVGGAVMFGVYDRRNVVTPNSMDKNKIAICPNPVRDIGHHTFSDIKYWVEDELELNCKLLSLGVPYELVYPRR